MERPIHTHTGTIHRDVSEKLDVVEVRSLRHGYMTLSPRRIKTTTFEVVVNMDVDMQALFERAAHRAAEAKSGKAKFVDGFITASVVSHKPLKVEERSVPSLEQQFPSEFEILDDE